MQLTIAKTQIGFYRGRDTIISGEEGPTKMGSPICISSSLKEKIHLPYAPEIASGILVQKH